MKAELIMMRAKAIAMVGLVLSLGFTLGTPVLSAEDSSVETMAVILVDLNHFPTDAQKNKLQAIVDDEAASEQEQAVASAMINLQHKATAADKEKMKTIMDDESISANLRELAGIVYRLDHKPNDTDKEWLSALIGD
jgi:hypothetical protein